MTPLVSFAVTRQLRVERRRQHHRARTAVRRARLADGQCGHRVGRIRPSVGAGRRQSRCRRRVHRARGLGDARERLRATRGTSDRPRIGIAGRSTPCSVSGMAGGISGDAPLFERFSLGDSRTLRGWDKYDIAPAGGDRMFHTSLEYRYRGLALFLDSGSVWDDGTTRACASRRESASTGPVLHDAWFSAQYRRVSERCSRRASASAASESGRTSTAGRHRRSAIIDTVLRLAAHRCPHTSRWRSWRRSRGLRRA